MKELKKYHLLQVKEKLKRQKSISELSQLEADAEKCETIKQELNRLEHLTIGATQPLAATQRLLAAKRF